MTDITIVSLSLCAITLWFNRWVVREEIKVLKLQLEAERTKRETTPQDQDAAKRKGIEESAHPFFIRSDREEAQLEQQMTRTQKEEDYFDEVAGLGR